jgi:peptidoglycan biosynthesis protein MviN/MurJ (putative lipid II flippase)
MWGVKGLAIAFSVSAIIQIAILLGVLHFKLDGFDDKKVLMSTLKIAIATLAAAGVAQALKTPLAEVVDMQRFWGIATQLIGSFTGGIITYIIVCMTLRSEELEIIKKYIPRKFRLVEGSDTSRFSGMME